MTDPNQTPSPTGVLVIDKAYGRTSTSVCTVVKARLRAGGAPKRVKVGHGGTLDPLASGVLVILIGKATKLCDQVMAGEKAYRAEVDLGVTSPTDDLESEAVPTPGAAPVARDRIEGALERFIGTIRQRPPAHSGVMIGGRRAYHRAGAGDAPAPEARPVVIHEISVAAYEWPRLTLDVRCGKGVYIRSLARDLGDALGVGGMLGGLRRTRVGRFTIEEAVTLDALPDPLTQGDLTITPEVERLLPKR
ncbi:MAG: tRNA pseudouridine(55) synthase TruB [Phycisphaerales bacterium JB059]